MKAPLPYAWTNDNEAFLCYLICCTVKLTASFPTQFKKYS